MKCSKIKKCWLAAFYLDEKMTAPNLPTRLEESFLSKKARLRRVAGLNHKTTCCRQLDKGKPLYALLSTKLHITHALPNWGIEGGFCNIGPLRRGLFLIFALQKSKKLLALLVSIRWTLFQTPTAAKRETVISKPLENTNEENIIHNRSFSFIQ